MTLFLTRFFCIILNLKSLSLVRALVLSSEKTQILNYLMF